MLPRCFCEDLAAIEKRMKGQQLLKMSSPLQASYVSESKGTVGKGTVKDTVRDAA